jgi:hypothetical protein
MIDIPDKEYRFLISLQWIESIFDFVLKQCKIDFDKTVNKADQRHQNYMLNLGNYFHQLIEWKNENWIIDFFHEWDN